MDSVQLDAESFIYAVRFDHSITLGALALLYYDYALTINDELEYYWSPPSLSLSFALFVLNRYVGLLGSIPVFFEYTMAFAEQRCDHIQFYHQIYSIVSQSIVAVLLILRTYALYNCSKRVLATLIVLETAGIIQGLVAILTSSSSSTSEMHIRLMVQGCDLSLSFDEGLHQGLAWSALLWFDTVIFILTFHKALKVRHEMSGGLLAVMLRDGAIYYAVLIVVNALNVVSFITPRSTTALRGSASTLTNVLSVTLASRLMLNLRDPSVRIRSRVDGPRTSSSGGWSVGRFSSRMMSFRAPGHHTYIETFELGELGQSTGTDSSGTRSQVLV